MQIEELLTRLEGVKRSGNGWSAKCPAHRDRNASLSIADGDKGIVLKCHAGCDVAAVTQALGLELQDLFPENNKLLSTPLNTRARVHAQAENVEKTTELASAHGLTVVCTSLTLEEYASAKALPVEFLSYLGLRDRKRDGNPAISIPYLDKAGKVVATRYRIAMAGDRFRWRTGAKPQLYGQWLLEDAIKTGYIVIVEGESDCHAAWFHKVPALGLPGATNWKDDRDAQHLEGIEKIYVVVEPDDGGEAVLKWLSTSAIKDRAHLIDLGEHKDLCGLHLAAGDGFDEAWLSATASAIPFIELEARAAEEEHKKAREACSDLIEEPDILTRFGDAVVVAGVVGETKIAKLIYLALTSRFFLRPISIVLKGPSAGGKSHTSQRVIDFFPEDACYALTAMSDRALAYSDEPLEHRFIVIYEAAGLESDFASYLLRSLLSEGCVRYETVEKAPEGGMQSRIIERTGPTGCLLTTTAPRMHPENETRMLSINVSDSREQTRVILDRLAEEVESDLDLDPWQALQTWLKGANHLVTIPYSKQLSALVPEIAVRLRRDFKHVLTLIRAHALLHQATREEDEKGRIVANLDDYAAIHDIVADVIAEGVEATVRSDVRQTVEAVKALLADGPDNVTVKQVAEFLELDASSVSRRVRVARSLGYIRNEETRRGMPAKLVTGDKMPEDAEILPHPDRLQERVHACTTDRGDRATQNISEQMVEVQL